MQVYRLLGFRPTVSKQTGKPGQNLFFGIPKDGQPIVQGGWHGGFEPGGEYYVSNPSCFVQDSDIGKDFILSMGRAYGNDIVVTGLYRVEELQKGGK